MAEYPAIDLVWEAGPGAPSLTERLHGELDGFEPLAIQERETDDGWRIFLRSAAIRDDAVAHLRAVLGEELAVAPVDVPDEGWAARSQAGLGPVRVGRLTIAPPWAVGALGDAEPPRTDAPGAVTGDPLLIVIEPSMGFGTGHHETTRLCLSLLQELPLEGRTVVDVGTGSGVLAIAAARLGAGFVLAIDNDPDAIVCARENVERNDVTAQVAILEAELSNLAGAAADVVTANLTGAVLQRHAAALARLVQGGGTAVVSGFGPTELEDVAGALGGTVARSLVEREWAAAAIILPTVS